MLGDVEAARWGRLSGLCGTAKAVPFHKADRPGFRPSGLIEAFVTQAVGLGWYSGALLALMRHGYALLPRLLSGALAYALLPSAVSMRLQQWQLGLG
jgi:hypothetical protein